MSDLVDRARAALDGVTPESWHPEYCEASNVWHIDAGAYPIGTEICKCKSDANARFIAAARSLVPDMADRIEALEKELAGGSFYQEKDIDALMARADRAAALLAEAVEALKDACSALDYIRYHYGDLHGVGFDRVRDKHDAMLARIKEAKDNG